MKNIVLTILLTILSPIIGVAQEMTVKSFYLDSSDLTASVNSRKDFNGEKCALVVVDVDVPLMKFYGNIIGDIERHQGKYFVYMTSGSKKLKIQHPDLTPLSVIFSEYGINGLAGGQTYRLNVELPEVARNSSFAADDNDTSRPKHLSLMCVKDNKPVYFTRTQWKNLKDKDSYKVYGLVIIDREEQFFIALEDYGRYTEAAIQPYLTELPTVQQVQAIIDDIDNVQGALEDFGGRKLDVTTGWGYYMVSKVDNELILGTTEFKWKFAGEINMRGSECLVRPRSIYIEEVKETPFNLPVSNSAIHDRILNARKEKNYAKAIEICKSIPDDPYAQYYLGVMYESGQGVESDPAEAFKWYVKGASQGDADCQYEVGRMCQYGIGTAQDNAEAAKWYTQAADNGSSAGQTAIGFMYLNGQGVAENLAEAVKYITQGAENGNRYARNCLGWMYATGKGVTKDDKKAFEWYGKAAEDGVPEAQFELGLFYYFGRGTEKDVKQAYDWWLKAAEQGNPTAQTNIGYLYKSGEGVAQDNAKAVEWYKKAADAGDAVGENNLGYMYQMGLGVPVNYAEALRLYGSAADKGYSEAQYSLGEMYEKGHGVNVSLDQAKAWYQKAADQGHEKARQALDRLAGNNVQTSQITQPSQSSQVSEDAQSSDGKTEEPAEFRSEDYDKLIPMKIELFDKMLPAILASKGNKSGVYSKDGFELVPCQYDEIKWVTDLKAFVVKDNNRYGILSIGGSEIIPVVLNSRPMQNIYRDVIPWFVMTVYPTDYSTDQKYNEKRDVILVAFDGTEFYRFKFKEIMEWNKHEKLVNKMNSKFRDADNKAGGRYSMIGEKKKLMMEKENANYFNVLQNENLLRKEARAGDAKAIETLKKVNVLNF